MDAEYRRRWRAGLALLCSLYVTTGASAALLFSEVMYHPPDGINPVDGDAYEFLELHNAGGSWLSLSNAYFSKGITYTFGETAGIGAGAYLVLVGNRTAFTNRYPAVTNLAAGIYTGALANGGEAVTLRDAGGSKLAEISYSDGASWPAAADGHGASLLPRSAAGDMTAATNWCAADAYLGTPGSAGVCASNDIVINEVLAHTDLPLVDTVELRNRTGVTVNPYGWYLSDNPVNRTKYRITNTVIAAGGYLVIDESQFGAGTDGNTPFALSELGDAVYLTAAGPASNLTRLVDFAVFDASENGVSLGRYPGYADDLLALSARTFGATNAALRVGPVVFGELMYHSANDVAEDEFIELLSITNGPVPLYDPAYPTNAWQITGGVSFTFPTGITLAAGSRLVVVGTTNTAAFRSRLGVPGDVTILGGWDGRLANGGETVKLMKPGRPETNMVPYILVEQVTYDDAAPWPKAADGNGASLERRVATDYADTAANWYAGGPGGSPGKAAVGGFVDPAVTPAAPASGQSCTVTVSVVAQSLPTQVVMQAETDGVRTETVMYDDGTTGGDTVSGDQVYSVVLPGATDTFTYLRFIGWATNGQTFTYPADDLDYVDAPSLTVRLSGGGLLTTVMAGNTWVTHTTTGTATSASTFYIYLDSAGEVLVDDVSVTDTATQTEHVRNGDFESGLDDWSAEGTHAGSFHEEPDDEHGNGVVHLLAGGAGTGSGNALKCTLSPDLTLDDPHVLTFRTRRTGMLTARWLWVTNGTPPADTVISELMYHPAVSSDVESAYEYVELYNPAGVSADLEQARLAGVGLTLPSNAWLQAGGRLVCCASQSVIQAWYGITNTVGNWSGALQNGGETLRLVNRYGRELDRVQYGDTDPWPVAADGYGPSLERLDPAAPGDGSVNWVGSQAATNWQTVAWTGVVGMADAPLRLYLDFHGRCYIDGVSVKKDGNDPELVSNGGFVNGTNGWEFLNNHARSLAEPGFGLSGGAGLAVVGMGSRWVIPYTADPVRVRYGDNDTNCVRSATLGTDGSSSYVVSMNVRRQGLGGYLHVVLGNVSNVYWLGHAGTPGSANTVATSGPGGVVDVDHALDVVAIGTANTMTARVEPVGSVTNLQLHYRAFGTNGYRFADLDYTSVALTNTATPGLFQGAVPGMATNWTLVRYHVTAQTTNGLSVRLPRLDDPSSDYGYWVQSSAVQTAMTNWHLLVDGEPVIYPFMANACVVSPEGEVYTDVIVRHRGRPSSSGADATGVAIRMNRGRLLDSWFANNLKGMNLRARANFAFQQRRVVNEYLAYSLQRELGLAAPRFRHVCAWFDGIPYITMSVEAPEDEFLKGNDISSSDYLSRAGYTGRRIVGGDNQLDNFNSVAGMLDAATSINRTSLVQTNLCMERVLPSLALLSLAAYGDQHFRWNMFQHRSAADGRWSQYPWDLDGAFVDDLGGVVAQTNLHPYYQTALHPSIWDGSTSNTLGQVLFYPESGAGAEQTRPYRYRHQASLWRHWHTWYTTNWIFPKLDRMAEVLTPAYTQLNLSVSLVTNQVAEVKAFIQTRRDFLMNGSWSDKDTALWAATNVYRPDTVVFNEILYDPGSGSEFVELYNTGSQTIDLGWWLLSAGTERYRIPHGTMLGPTSCLAIVDNRDALAAVYPELVDTNRFIRRYQASPVWDGPVNWTTATDYASRVVEIPQLSLPNDGATLILRDLCSNVVDTVTYRAAAPWAQTTNAVSLELYDPSVHNDRAAAWYATGGGQATPAMRNGAAADQDGDGLADGWEVLFFGNTNRNGSGDFDSDGLSDGAEFAGGSDPSVAGAAWWLSRAVLSGGTETNDYALANQGQLKWIAKQAYHEMDLQFPDGAGSVVSNLVAGLSATNNYRPVVVGQVKNTASVIYNRFDERGYELVRPWTTNTTADDNDYAPANVGQVKRAFDLTF